MSFDLIRQAWNTPCHSHTQKVVLAALACAANEVGECWPSIETLMQRCDLTRRAVQIQIRALKDAGLLEIKDGGGKHVSNRYILKLPNSAQDTLNGKRRIPYSVSDDVIQRTPCTKQRIRCAPSASISQEQPGGRNPLPYLKSLEKLIERAEKESERIFRAHCLENSIGGNKWNPPSAEFEYASWRQQRAEAKAKIKNGEYIV